MIKRIHPDNPEEVGYPSLTSVDLSCSATTTFGKHVVSPLLGAGISLAQRWTRLQEHTIITLYIVDLGDHPLYDPLRDPNVNPRQHYAMAVSG